ncbi:MAG: hypothetical protein FWD70_05195 [Desulfuromonadales bacterium]|nr:hypothetical protein [Desulfuromonadales bacterium]
MTEETSETKPAEKRLCTEIQLFDLCSLDVCSYRDGKFCTNSNLLAKFENIVEEDDKPVELYMEENPGETEEAGNLEYGEAYETDEYEEEYGE